LALCQECHKSRAKVELEWRGFMAKLTTNELKLLQESLGRCLYWYDRERLFTFVGSLSRYDVDQLNQLSWLIETRGHPKDRGEIA
jgi:hypothetical protein